jgi:hypothetical protein
MLLVVCKREPYQEISLRTILRIEQSFLWELMGIREEEVEPYVKFRSKLSRIDIREES